MDKRGRQCKFCCLFEQENGGCEHCLSSDDGHEWEDAEVEMKLRNAERIGFTGVDADGVCWCERCRDSRETDMERVLCRGMLLCPYCGNKRCPRVDYHGWKCCGSNEPDQVGGPIESEGEKGR